MNKMQQKFDAINVMLFVVICFPLYKIHWNSYTIIALLLFGIYSNSNKEAYKALVIRVKNNLETFIKSTLIFYFFLFSLLYSENSLNGVESLIRLLPIVLLPGVFFFLFKPINKAQLNNVLFVFLIVSIVSALYINYNIYSLGLFRQMEKVSFFNMPIREAVMSLKFEPLHPTYISLWYSFSLMIIVHFFKQTKNVYLIIVFFILGLLLLGTIVILSSRIAFLTLFSLAILLIVTQGPKKNKMFFVIVLVFLALYSLTQVSFISSRVLDEFKQTELAPPVGKRHNSLNIRVGIYSCSIKLVKQNLFLGYGVGDVQQTLNDCYANYHTDVYLMTNYNSHSYFLHVLLVGGLLAILPFLYMFYFFVKIAIQSKDFLYGSFLLIVVLSMLFENTISRNHGILFFTIFNCIFISHHYLNNQNANSNNSIIPQ